MLSAQEHTQVIRDYLATECAEGRVVGPLTPAWAQAMQISQFGVIPIRDLVVNGADGASANSGIDKGLCSLTYASVDKAARRVIQLGKGALMVKVDIKAAYRLVPVHPEDRWLLGMQFKGATYMDTVLPFGLRSAPKIFNAVADALNWACQREGVRNSLHYLDDFLLIGSLQSHECALPLHFKVCVS